MADWPHVSCFSMGSCVLKKTMRNFGKMNNPRSLLLFSFFCVSLWNRFENSPKVTFLIATTLRNQVTSIGVSSRWLVPSSIRVSSDRAGRSLLPRRWNRSWCWLRVDLAWISLLSRSRVAHRPLTLAVAMVVMMAGLRVPTST